MVQIFEVLNTFKIFTYIKYVSKIIIILNLMLLLTMTINEKLTLMIYYNT